MVLEASFGKKSGGLQGKILRGMLGVVAESAVRISSASFIKSSKWLSAAIYKCSRSSTAKVPASTAATTAFSLPVWTTACKTAAMATSATGTVTSTGFRLQPTVVACERKSKAAFSFTRTASGSRGSGRWQLLARPGRWVLASMDEAAGWLLAKTRAGELEQEKYVAPRVRERRALRSP